MKTDNKKLLHIQSTQGFSPIREVRDGIICTKDERYVKLLEFSPVNFSLRGADEQALIINQFAMVLRTLPDNIHFKVVQQRADVSKVLTVLQDHYNQEENPRCQRLQLEQMRMISEVGANQGVSRRFFLSFEYEPPNWAAKGGVTWDKILQGIEETELSIRASMEACGNECLTPPRSDSWTLETLYTIFSRGQAETTPYSTREFATIAKYAGQPGYDFENHDYILPTNDLICPSLLDDSASPNYIAVQGSPDTPTLYYTFAYIPGRDYPKACLAGWTISTHPSTTTPTSASIVDNQATVYFDDKVKDDVNVLARVTVFVPFEGDDVTTYKHCRLIPVAKRISDFPFYETITRLCQERWG